MDNIVKDYYWFDKTLHKQEIPSCSIETNQPVQTLEAARNQAMETVRQSWWQGMMSSASCLAGIGIAMKYASSIGYDTLSKIPCLFGQIPFESVTQTMDPTALHQALRHLDVGNKVAVQFHSGMEHAFVIFKEDFMTELAICKEFISTTWTYVPVICALSAFVLGSAAFAVKGYRSYQKANNVFQQKQKGLDQVKSQVQEEIEKSNNRKEAYVNNLDKVKTRLFEIYTEDPRKFTDLFYHTFGLVPSATSTMIPQDNTMETTTTEKPSKQERELKRLIASTALLMTLNNASKEWRESLFLETSAKNMKTQATAAPCDYMPDRNVEATSYRERALSSLIRSKTVTVLGALSNIKNDPTQQFQADWRELVTKVKNHETFRSMIGANE